MNLLPREHDKDYQRLKTLYSISKDLATFSNMKESFPKIFTQAGNSFPLLSVVLIEHWEEKTQTAIWFSSDSTQEMVDRATINAKNTYSFLLGASPAHTAKILMQLNSINELVINDNAPMSKGHKNPHYIALPLIIDNLPPLGVLQLEGGAPLDEQDLEFANALADLMSVALDRYYKSKKERAFQNKEKKENLASISKSQHKVIDLETEREMREAFVSLLTHDLRTPLSVILISAQMILKRNNIDEFSSALSSKIITNVNRVGQMITNLLDANRIRSGEKLPLNIVLTNITELIHETITELTIIHGDRFEIEGDKSIQGYCDPSGIKRIIENLSTNAVKYGFRNTPIKIALDETESHILISVQNQGELISSEDQITLFDQFRRSEDAERSFKKGWGIGLTLVRGVAEAHNGQVTVSSDALRGTVFTVILPKTQLLND